MAYTEVWSETIVSPLICKKLISSKYDSSIIIDKNWLDYWKIRFENPLDDAESLEVNDDGYIKNIGQKVTDIKNIQGQYIGLMKFQNTSIIDLVKIYHNAKNDAKLGTNPLNPDIDFQNSYMTDFLNFLISLNFNLKSIEIENGWLELDSISDYNIYKKMYDNNTLKIFFNPV